MRFVQSSKPVTTNHKTLGELSVDVETPQFDSMDEFVSAAGGETNALDFINGEIDTNAKNGGRAYLRTVVVEGHDAKTFPGSKEFKDIVAKVQEIARKYVPKAPGADGPSKAKKAEVYDDVKALLASAEGATISKEQLLEILAKAR